MIAISGTATPKMLARYLKEARVTAQIVDRRSKIGPHVAYADMIFADPTYLAALQDAIEGDPHQWVPARICISELGDTAPDRLLETGVAEDLLLAPLSRRDVMEQIERIFDKTLRGKAALSSAKQNDAGIAGFKGQSVLAADDSAVNREVVSEALTRLNLRPTLVADGREAVAAAATGGFDLVLMDCSMPNMDGFEATREIRRREGEKKRNRMPIVALTAHVKSDDVAWREAGMDDYLTKPFTIEALATVVGRYLETAPEGVVQFQEPKPTSASPEDVFNTAVLDQLAAMQTGDSNLPLRALTLFQSHSRDAMKRLLESRDSGDAAIIAKAAHALKSMSVNVGAQLLAAACAEIENKARDGADVSTLGKLIGVAGKRFRKTHGALPEIMQKYDRRAA